MASNIRLRLLTSTLLIGTAGIATPALAQSRDTQPESPISSQPAGDAEQRAEVGEIVVTGSRIRRPDLTSASPIAVVNDEEFTLSGAVNVEQVINTLPQVIPGATSFSNNPGGGVATLNLRGLGATRNLVLVNGRRYIFFDASQVVDLNTVPSFLVDSVEVVSGGGSAVYGSDALAGVINFRLRNDINGVVGGAQYNITERGDGRRFNAYTAIGTQFPDGRGNVAVYAEYYKRGQIGQGDRDFSRFALVDGANGLVPGGSANVPEGRFVATGGAGVPTATIGAGTNYIGSGAFFATPGASRPYAGNTDAYNYAPANFLMVPQERWTLGGYGEYEIADGINAFAEVNFINNRVENELAATPITQNVDYNLTAIRPFVSAADFAQLQTIAARQQAANAAAAAAGRALPFGAFTAGTGQFGALQPGFVRLTTNYRVTQIANRNASDDRNAFRVLTGLRGDITNDLSYEAYYMYARTRNAQVQEGNVSRSAFTRLAGNGTCNVFGAGQLSDACISGASILAQNNEISELQVASGSVSGSLFQSPWANQAVGFALGAEWRKMSAQFIPDTALQSGDVVGFNAGQSTQGSYDVKEVFAELNVPLIQDGFINLLEINGAARYSDYSLEAVGGVWTYAVRGILAPIRDIQFRAAYQRAVRAPNVAELFGGQSVGFPAATDPCALASAATNATIRDVCIATGVPAANVGQAFLQPNTQIEGRFGGNPDLEEEVADTYTAGVVIRPRFIPRLNVTADYYDIRIENAIATAGGGVNGILNLCYNVIQDASSPLCQLIQRDTQGIISGPPNVVSAGNANLASLRAKGVDVQVDYTQPLGFSMLGGTESRLNFFFLASYTEENSFTPVVGVDEVVRCAGRFGNNCDDPTPRWKWSSRLSLLDGPMTASIRWRHLNAVTDDDEDTDYFVERIDDYDVFDLAIGFNVNDNFTLNLGVNNIFDKDPPVIGDNQEQANTYPGTYDVLGRDFFVSAQFRF